jgi:transcription initiation factor IIE alpha subunit
MLEGKCPKCGMVRYGWALLNPRHQTCSACGIGLEIYENGQKILKGFSPFESDRIDIRRSESTNKFNQP